MPTQMPSTGPAAREPAADDPRAVDGREPGHARRERPDAGHDQPVGVQRRVGSAVTTTSAPTRRNARSAERRLPDP